MIKKNFKIKEEIYMNEIFFQNISIDLILKINIEKLTYIDSYIGSSLAAPLTGFLKTHRIVSNNMYEVTYEPIWYKLYYLNYILIKQIMNKNNKFQYEKTNLLVISLKSRQLRITLLSAKNTIFNISVGRILSSLAIHEKSKKKSNKGERLFLEYLVNFFQDNINKLGDNKTTIMKINYFKKYFPMEEQIYKICNKYLYIMSNSIDIKLPNNYFKYKKIRSIKRRLTKRIIKDENSLNNF